MTDHDQNESAIDTILRTLAAVAPLTVEESGDEENAAVFRCPTCDGQGDIAADEVLTLHASPHDFPIGAMGLQWFGVGEGHLQMQKAFNDLPKEIAALRAERDAALARVKELEGEEWYQRMIARAEGAESALCQCDHYNSHLEAERDQLKADNERMRVELDKARKFIKHLELQLTMALHERQNVRDERDRLKADNERMRGMLREAQSVTQPTLREKIEASQPFRVAMGVDENNRVVAEEIPPPMQAKVNT